MWEINYVKASDWIDIGLFSGNGLTEKKKLRGFGPLAK
jgi:hypothetical protein